MEAEQFTEHITRVELSGGTLLSLTPAKNWTLLFLAFWLAGWSTLPIPMLTTTYKQAFLQKQFDWFNLLWSVGWAWGLMAVSCQIIWKLAGSELLRLSPSEIEVTKKLFRFSLRSRKAFLVDVRNLRYIPPGTR